MAIYTVQQQDIQKVMRKLDIATPRQRLSVLENEVEAMTKKFRDSLTAELLKHKQDEIAHPSSGPCTCGGTLEFKDSQKKT